MAQNQTPAFFPVAFLLLAAATPLALALAPPVVPYIPTVGSLLTKITVYSKLCCNNPTLSCPGKGPLAGATATLICFIGGANGANVNVSQGISDAGGNYYLTIANSPLKQLAPAAIVGLPLPCSIDVRIPAGTTCTLINSGNSINIGVPVIASVFLGSYGLEGLATVANSQPGDPAPV